MKKICYDLEIHTYQIDFVGHVNNAVYVQWMEIGRSKLLDEIGLPVHTIAKQGFVPILVYTDITYKTPLHLGDQVRAELWFIELRQASGTMKFHFYNGADVLVAEGHQKGLFVDRETMRPRRLQPDERELFLPYVQTVSVD